MNGTDLRVYLFGIRALFFWGVGVALFVSLRESLIFLIQLFWNTSVVWSTTWQTYSVLMFLDCPNSLQLFPQFLKQTILRNSLCQIYTVTSFLFSWNMSSIMKEESAGFYQPVDLLEISSFYLFIWWLSTAKVTVSVHNPNVNSIFNI